MDKWVWEGKGMVYFLQKSPFAFWASRSRWSVWAQVAAVHPTTPDLSPRCPASFLLIPPPTRPQMCLERGAFMSAQAHAPCSVNWIHASLFKAEELMQSRPSLEPLWHITPINHHSYPTAALQVAWVNAGGTSGTDKCSLSFNYFRVSLDTRFGLFK